MGWSELSRAQKFIIVLAHHKLHALWRGQVVGGGLVRALMAPLDPAYGPLQAAARPWRSMNAVLPPPS